MPGGNFTLPPVAGKRRKKTVAGTRVNCCLCTDTSVRRSITPMDLDTDRSGWTILSVRARRVPWDFVHTTAGADTTAHTAKTCLSVATPRVHEKEQNATVALQRVILSVSVATLHLELE